MARSSSLAEKPPMLFSCILSSFRFAFNPAHPEQDGVQIQKPRVIWIPFSLQAKLLSFDMARRMGKWGLRAWSCLIQNILWAHVHIPAPHCSQHPLPGVAVLSPAEERLSQCSLFLQAQDWLTLGRICWCSLTTHTPKGNRAHTHKNSFLRITLVGFLSQQAIRAKGRCCYICASN